MSETEQVRLTEPPIKAEEIKISYPADEYLKEKVHENIEVKLLQKYEHYLTKKGDNVEFIQKKCKFFKDVSEQSLYENG